MTQLINSLTRNLNLTYFVAINSKHSLQRKPVTRETCQKEARRDVQPENFLIKQSVNIKQKMWKKGTPLMSCSKTFLKRVKGEPVTKKILRDIQSFLRSYNSLFKFIFVKRIKILRAERCDVMWRGHTMLIWLWCLWEIHISC